MSALINISQLLGAGIGTPGVARNDIWLDKEVLLEDSVGGNSSWTWTLLSKPLGSATTLNSSNTSTTTLTPDQPGTYRVKLATNGGGPGNEHILVFRVRKTNTGAALDRGWALPAVGERPGESNYLVDGLPNTRNWSEPFEAIFADILANFGGGGTVTDVTGVAPLSSTGGATPALSIAPASGGSEGSMSSAHFTLVDGATDAATPSTLVKRDGSGRFQAAAGVAPSDVATVSQLGGGGAPSRIVALDANDIASWKLDDAAEPWADGVGSLSLTGYGGLGSYAPAVVTGGSIHGDRCVFCDWSVNAGLRSDATTVGEVAAGTVHGWALLTQEPGALFTKDEGSSIYLRTAGSGPATSYELLAKIGNSGEVSVARIRYRALVHSGGWTHFAMTWSGGTAYVYVNGVRLPAALAYSSITWGAGRWRFGKTDYLGSISALMSSWRICNVARSAAYINEVFKRAVGWWP